MYEVIVAKSGDRAEAPTQSAALLAADVLCRDYADAGEGTLEDARQTVVILSNGVRMRILTELARAGRGGLDG